MRTTHPQEIRVYQTPNGREPFNEWLNSIRAGLTHFYKMVYTILL